MWQGGGCSWQHDKLCVHQLAESALHRFQNPWPYYQVSNKSMSIPHLGQGIFGYRTESKTPYNATRNQCVNAIVTTAMSYVGNTPYVRDYSCAPGVGVDCSGLVMQALCAMGMDLSPMNPWDHYYTPGPRPLCERHSQQRPVHSCVV